MGDWSSTHRLWDKWASNNVGSISGEPLKAALLINHDPSAPSRLLSVMTRRSEEDLARKLKRVNKKLKTYLRTPHKKTSRAEQEGIQLKPIDLQPFLDFIKRNNLQTEYFFVGSSQYIVTSIHEHWFCARCVNTSKAAGEGVIVMQTAGYLLVAMYEGSIGSASRAMVAADQFMWLLSRRSY